MKLTKFQHACFTLEKEGKTLIVDPGAFSHDFIVPEHAVGVVITHEHPDHLDPALIKKIIAKNPTITIVGHESITAKYAQTATLPVHPGEPYTLGPFTLQFFGGSHAPIGEGIVTPPNFGVLIDASLYYPGDSFVLPDIEGLAIKTLALPISAPWLDFARTQDFLVQARPGLAFPTHDGILSEDGKQLAERMVGGAAQHQGTVYQRLDGQSIELT